MKMWKITTLLFLAYQYDFSTGDLGSEIRQRVEQQLSHLKYLGDDIRKKVDRQLAPVRAMQVKIDLSNGIGGVTTITYSGEHPRNFIVRNGNRFECHGELRGPNCDGPVEPFTFKSKEDMCFANSYAALNDYICLSNGGLNVQMKNNDVFCRSNDDSSVLMLTEDQYHKMCGKTAYFTYYADPADPKSIKIPNPLVQCLNNEPGVCQFTETGKAHHNSVVSTYSRSYDYHFS